jgi:hypothetical protein
MQNTATAPKLPGESLPDVQTFGLPEPGESNDSDIEYRN